MNLKSIIRTGILAILPVLFASCEKETVLELPDIAGKYIIVEGVIDDRFATQWIRLSRSNSYYDHSMAPPVSDAYVKISDGERDYIFRESNDDSLKGFYLNNALSNHLKNGPYTLSIEHGGELFSARSEFRSAPQIDSVSVALNILTRLGITTDSIYDISIHFNNLPGNDNYYLTNYYINNKLKTARPNDKTTISGENLQGYVSLVVNMVNKKDIAEGDLLTVELRTISKEQYDFYTELFFQTRLSGNPFAGSPPANIRTNLSEGALGFFQVSSVSFTDKKFSHNFR
jgi:hypothetical protein